MEFGLQITKIFMELSLIYAAAYIVTRYTGWFGVGVETVGVIIMLIIEGWIFYAAAMATNLFDETVAMMLIVWGASILMAIIGGVNGFIIRRHVKKKKSM